MSDSYLRLGLELVRVRMAFGQSLLGADTDREALDWTDVSDYVASIDGAVALTVTRGRDSPLIEFEPAQAMVLLDNSDGRFDPAMTTGPEPFVVSGVSQCQPDTPIWIDVPAAWTGLAEDEPVFLGTVNEFPATREVGGIPTVQIQCSDLLRMFDLTPLRTRFVEQTTDERVDSVLDALNFPEESVSEPVNRVLYSNVGVGSSTCVPTQLTGHTGAEHLANVLRTEGHNAFVTIDKRGDFIRSDRHIVFEAPFTDISAVFGQGPGELPYMGIEWSSGERYIYNQIECSIVSRTGGSPVTINAGPAPAGADSIPLIFFDLGFLEGDIPAGASIDLGTGRVVTLRENASEGDGALAIYPISQPIVTCKAEWNPSVAIAADNASQILHGKRRLSRSGQLFSSLAPAQAMAWDLLWDFQDPHPRVESINCSGIVSTELSEALLGLAIGNRETIRDWPKYADEPIEMDMILQKISHTVRPRDWDTTLNFSPAPQDRVFAMLTDVEATTAYLSDDPLTTMALYF